MEGTRRRPAVAIAVIMAFSMLLVPMLQAAPAPERPGPGIDGSNPTSTPPPAIGDDIGKNNHKPCGPASGCLPIDGPQFVDEHGDRMFGNLIMESVLWFPSRDSQTSADAAGSDGSLDDEANTDHQDQAPWGIVMEEESRLLMNDSSLVVLENGSRLVAREDAQIDIPGLPTSGGDVVNIQGNDKISLQVDDQEVLRLLNTTGTANIIGANETNDATAGTVGVIISGGGSSGSPHVVTDHYGTISGGEGNQAGDDDGNPGTAEWATVGGGVSNTANGTAATVPGGQDNTASGDHSYAAGQGASADHDGTYVWSDAATGPFASTGADQYLIDAGGGVGIGTNSPASALSVEGDVTPATNATHALGSPELRWTDLFLNSVIHHNGDLTFVDTSGTTTATLATSGSLEVPATMTAGTFVGNGSGLSGVQAEEVATDSVDTNAVIDGEITTSDLADASVTTAKVADGTLVAADADTTSLQERVTGSCAPGQSIREIAQDGTVTCEVDDNTEYTAGNGLNLDGTTFQLDQSCATDEFLRWDGTSWGCSTETGDISSVTASTGLTGGGTSGDVSLAVDTSAIQERVTGSCSGTTSIAAINQDGTVSCEGDDDTTYSNGFGLDLSGTTFSADTTEVQERVTGTCGTDASIDAVNSDGTVSCETDDDTTYTAGTGLTLSGTEFSNDLGTSIESSEITDGTIAFADLGQNGCTSDQIMRWDDDFQTWECDDRHEGDITSVDAGTGLTGGGDSGDVTLGVDTTAIQERVSGTCGTDASIDAVNSDGTVSCETDDDTTYTAGDGLGLSGTTFELRQDCSSAEMLVWSPDGSSSWRCQMRAPDAEALQGLGPSSFLSSDTSDTFTGSSLTFFPSGNDGFDLTSGCCDDVEIRRDASGDDNDWFRVYSEGIEQMRINNGDEASTDFDGAVNANGLDLAELYEAREPMEAGEVVALDPSLPGGVVKTTEPAQADAIGVVSTDPGMVLSPHGIASEADIQEDLGPEAHQDYLEDKPALVEQLAREHPKLAESPEGRERLETLAVDAFLKDAYAPVALSGRVPVQATAENGPIQPGDLLTSAAVPGKAAKATNSGPVIGTALEGLEDGTGEILLFVNPGWHGERSTELVDRVQELEQENRDLEQRLDRLEQVVTQMQATPQG